jgi:hypothetical protein
MSLYNILNGINQATFYILPMLGKHPEQYPRFRDCFVGKLVNSSKNDQFGIPLKKQKDLEKKLISVYTRVGGNNRKDYKKEIEELRAIPEYVEDYDDSFDNTFATFVFKVPAKWEKDYDLIVEGKIQKISKEYQEEMIRVYPKLEEELRQKFN